MERAIIATNPPYPALIGEGLITSAGALTRELGLTASTVALVADATVDRLYGDATAAAFASKGYRVARVRFPAGEEYKNLNTLSHILNALAREQLTRTDLVAALGGGVTGDLAGFAAGVYLRGIPYIGLPTTLLAAVDSSIGGKTAVNLFQGKNLAGCFHQPAAVLCDCATFASLPGEILLDGVAEGIKAGVLRDALLFDRFASGAFAADYPRTVARCVAIKGAFVAADTLDAGERQLLNLGHTIGHAIEAESGFTIPHGHGVAMGMAGAARAAVQMGFCTKETAARIEQALQGAGLPTKIPYAPERLAAHARLDKKRAGESITLVLPCEIGRCILYSQPIEALTAFFRHAVGEYYCSDNESL